MTLTPHTRPHAESHFTGSEFVRDIVIGMSDGLDEDDAARVVQPIKADKKRWVDFMMRFELGLGAAQTVIVGGLAASAAFLIAKALG